MRRGDCSNAPDAAASTNHRQRVAPCAFAGSAAAFLTFSDKFPNPLPCETESAIAVASDPAPAWPEPSPAPDSPGVRLTAGAWPDDSGGTGHSSPGRVLTGRECSVAAHSGYAPAQTAANASASLSRFLPACAFVGQENG